MIGRRFAGVLVVGVIIALVTGALAGLASAAGAFAEVRMGGVASVIRFTILQAGLSTILSLLLGAALALALARRRFLGRTVFLAMLGAVAALPAIIVVFALTAIFGRAGIINDAIALLGGERVSIYGLGGILLAHVFFNAPFAARVYLAAVERTPGEHWRLASSLGMPPLAIIRLIDGPAMLRETAPLAVLIFLLCATSFAIPLTLGGGPAAATLEVAIFEALRFDVDFARAAILAAVQLLLLGALVVLATPLLRRPIEEAVTGRIVRRPDAEVGWLRLLDGGAIALGALLVVPPLIAIAASARALPAVLDARILAATVTSLAVALPAAFLSVAAAYALATARLAGRGRGGLFAATPLAAYAMPPLALVSGLYIAARAVGDPALIAWPALVLVNALMALPFAYRLIEAPLLAAEARYGRVAASLGIVGFARLRLVEAPLLAGPAGVALALAAALSLGDLGVIALFGGEGMRTLPYLLYERLGAYRLGEAEAVAAVLTALVLGLFLIARRFGGVHADRA